MEPGEGQRSVRAPDVPIADALAAHGFTAHTEDRGESTAWSPSTALFGEAATQHPVICAWTADWCGDSWPACAGRSPTSRSRSCCRSRGDDPRRAGLQPLPATTSTTPPPRRHVRAVAAMIHWLELVRGHTAADPHIPKVPVPTVERAPTGRRPARHTGPGIVTSGGEGAVVELPGPARGGRRLAEGWSTPRSATRAARAGHQCCCRCRPSGRIEAGVEEVLEKAAGDGAPATLVHCQVADHEVGAVGRGHRRGSAPWRLRARPNTCMTTGHIAIDVNELGADLVSVSAHKLGGPPGDAGVGGPAASESNPSSSGASRKRPRRGGIENIVGIIRLRSRGAGRSSPGGRPPTDRCHPPAPTTVEAAARRAIRRPQPTSTPPGVRLRGRRRSRTGSLGLDQSGMAAHSGSCVSCGVSGSVTGAGRHGRRRRVLAGCRWAGPRPMTTWRRSRPRSRGSWRNCGPARLTPFATFSWRNETSWWSRNRGGWTRGGWNGGGRRPQLGRNGLTHLVKRLDDEGSGLPRPGASRGSAEILPIAPGGVPLGEEHRSENTDARHVHAGVGSLRRLL